MTERFKSVTSALGAGFLEKFRGNIVVITPPYQEGIKDDGSWGQHNPGNGHPPFWMQSGPAWVQNVDDRWKDRVIFEFRGRLTPEITQFLGKNDATILEGSETYHTWRVSVPTANLEGVRKFLISSKVDYIKRLTVK